MNSPIAITKIGYRKPDAAAFVGLKETKFMSLVNEDRMPKPFKIDGCTLLDGRELMQCFLNLKREATKDNEKPKQTSGLRSYEEIGHAG